MSARAFRAHGEFCASHPWEVIVATLTFTACMLTVDQQKTLAALPRFPATGCIGCLNNESKYNAADVIVMTLIRCLAVLYSYYQFRNLHRLGSKYILGIAGLFTVFSSFVFMSSVLNFLQINVSELKDAMFFFLLLIDLSKAVILAEFALSASNQEEVKTNIAKGMSVLGPAITLDTIVETLVIGVGTLSGVYRLEIISYFACLSVLVNYAVFMTFYPACLSLILELSRVKNPYAKKTTLLRAFKEEDHKSNPVIQRVKLIMSVGLMLVHTHSWWTFRNEPNGSFVVEQSVEDNPSFGYIMKWITPSIDHIVILILLLALVVKFIFFEKKDDLELRAYIATEMKLNVVKQKVEDKNVQTEHENESFVKDKSDIRPMRSLDACLSIYKNYGAIGLTDEEVALLVSNKHIPAYEIENVVRDNERGVSIRRDVIAANIKDKDAFKDLPYKNYDYSKVKGSCCENVIGYMPVPVGVAGPLNLDGRLLYVPLATTEGCLVASTHRGCKAVLKNGVKTKIISDGMTRGPVIRFPSLEHAANVLSWIENPQNFNILKETFDSTSRFARLEKIQTRLFGRLLYLRFVAKTGDAMGMNMLSKGTDKALNYIKRLFPEIEILSLSGNFCTDKKPAAVNWIEGRGKSVISETIIPSDVVQSVLKTTTASLVDVNISKNLIGSAASGSIGGFNAHAANIVTAIYIATGQDPAQNVVSSNCMTIMEPWGENGKDLYITCTMPSVEIGTIGGGTVLPAQSACLDMLGVKGANLEFPGENANQLARIICATVLAGELSLMAALTTSNLVQSHLKYNRSTTSQDIEENSNDIIPKCKTA